MASEVELQETTALIEIQHLCLSGLDPECSRVELVRRLKRIYALAVTEGGDAFGLDEESE